MSLPSDRNARFAGWTPELIDQACAEYDARQAELQQAMQHAYAEGRKDEREEWADVLAALEDALRCMEAVAFLKEQETLALVGLPMPVGKKADALPRSALAVARAALARVGRT